MGGKRKMNAVLHKRYKEQKQRKPNIWKARNIETGEIEYVIGHYNEEDNLYTHILTRTERKKFLSTYQVDGSFAELANPCKETTARQQAILRHGYSKMAKALHNLGEGYEAIV